jgi:hypothetical protein
MIRRSWRWLRGEVVRRILGVDDTPLRIAWGALLGVAIAWTPTFGFQIMLYLAISALLRANKLSGIPLLFISNPVTAVPMYVFAWKVGAFISYGGQMPPVSEAEKMRKRLAESDVPDGFWSRMVSLDFWEEAARTVVAMGADMWIGSLVMGLATGIPTYVLVYMGVKEYRRRHMKRDYDRPPESERGERAG